MREWRSSRGLTICWHDVVTSTNDIARQWAIDGAVDGSTVCADQQSAGRGRRGAAWICPPGQALAFSQILRPAMPRSLWPRLALIAGLAVAKCLEQSGLYAEVKWPNDVLVAGKKIAGILVEAMDDFVIIGVGLNVNVAEFPDEIESTATSMMRETEREWEREELLEDLMHSMHAHTMLAEHDFSDLLRQLRERCALTGKRVSLWIGDELHEVLARGISESGELLIEIDGRIEALLQADQIRVIG